MEQWIYSTQNKYFFTWFPFNSLDTMLVADAYFFLLNMTQWILAVPGFIDPVFAKTSPKGSFSIPENERSGLVFAKTGPINSVTGRRLEYPIEV